ncbi:MAG: hypothetical protein LBU65_14875, partial [Planctomycetaceae bacterium]|nr:hypothetical protein [Planctomycetaceae bacterium]
MFRNQKIVAVAIIVLLSLAALIQITWHRSHKVPLVPQGSQAEYLSKWHDMKRILLTDANIKNFVGDMLQADVLKLPPGTSKVSIDDLTAEQRQDIQEALEGFFTVYR